MRRIQEHIEVDSVGGARADIAVSREKTRQLAERIEGIRRKQQSAISTIAGFQQERARLNAEVGHFINAAVQLGIEIEGGDLPPNEQLRERHASLQNEIGTLTRLNLEAAKMVDTLRALHANAKRLAGVKKEELADRKAELDLVQEEADSLRDDPRLTQVSIDISDEQLAEAERLNREGLASLKIDAAKCETDVAQRNAELGELRREVATLKSQLTALRTQLTNLQNKLTQVSVRLEESELPSAASEEFLLSQIEEESRRHAQILALRDSVSNLELAIDTATTAAALTQLLNSLRTKEKAVAHATKKRDIRQPWVKYFNELARMVASQRNDAIASFTKEYGPRTSIIQRRLRSVYGFDDIEIQSRESAISVRVKRQGVELRPTDYFSQSQQQTLLLGLFLTSCSSQTWSAFSPVFLDDPVTHFDDLNTYAFLDLIVGLLESDFGKRQFIISTCDEKLLQLARQKFRHLGENAKFYRFGAIGSEGPTVEES